MGLDKWESESISPRELDNWHCDGDFFLHFLDSPEQGLLIIPLYSDIKPRGGGTYIAEDGVGSIARWLRDHPEGIQPGMGPGEGKFDFIARINECNIFTEMTGERGDVILLHPLMLHSASKNHTRAPRLITNPPVSLKEPFNFNRENPAEFSLVELKTLKELGVDRLDFIPTAPRQKIVPKRLDVQSKLLAEELERMRAHAEKTGVPIDSEHANVEPDKLRESLSPPMLNLNHHHPPGGTVALPPLVSMDLLDEYLPGLAISGAIVQVASSTPSEGGHVYDLSFSRDKATHASDALFSFNLGIPGHNVTGSLRLTREKCFWLFARQSHSLPADTDTQIFALRSSSHVLVALPLTTESYLGAFRGPMHEDERGSIFVRFEQVLPPAVTGKVVIAIAPNLNIALKNSVQHARSILGKPDSISSGASTLFKNQLTYCTWDSLQPPVPTCAKSALQTLEYLNSLGIRPATLLLDDSWQDVNSFRTLQSFDASASFLDGYKNLAEIVKTAKAKYGVRDVGVWHTIQGYWSGVDTDKFASRYKLVKVKKDGYPGPTEPPGFQYYMPHPDSIGSFFHDYYSALRAAGVTFAKCDNMASIDHIVSAVEASFIGPWMEIPGDPVDVPQLKEAYVRAVKAAARESFGEENVVWCMGMTPRLLLGEIGLGGDGLKRTVRNSDDYFPHEPDAHRYHVFTNVLNGLFLNNLDVHPDFDMFQTHAYISPQSVQNNTPAGLAQGAFHASFRVFGTGPVTITDVPLKSNPEILHKIVGNTSPTTSSPSLVVQASQAFTVLDEVFNPAIMEGGNGKGLKVYVNNTIGVWNVRAWHGKVVEFVTPPDITQALSLLPKSPLPPVIVYIQSSNPSSSSRTLFYGTTDPIRPAPPVRIDLDILGWATVGVAVIEQAKEVACLGLVDKYLSARGVEKAELKGGVYSVGRVGVSLVDDSGVKGAEQQVEFETEGLAKGKRITVQVKGRSEVLFELL
ncbi:hypothetical protein FRC06_002955 [Ceratobasidium sp. 370]|nr:hypothetical protein FRC06_002955 [Ceratobasidium sp. 370]